MPPSLPRVPAVLAATLRCRSVAKVPRCADVCVRVGDIPHHLPGQNPYIDTFAIDSQVPVEAARGVAQTMYPEYRTRLATLPIPPRRK
jgi:hypothetical protein